MTTQPDDGPTEYPDAWRRHTKQDTAADQVVEYLRGLSPASRHILWKRVGEGDHR